MLKILTIHIIIWTPYNGENTHNKITDAIYKISSKHSFAWINRNFCIKHTNFYMNVKPKHINILAKVVKLFTNNLL